MKKTRSILLAFICIGIGSVTAFAQTKTKNQEEKRYDNLIAFHPLHTIANSFLGVGFSYEKAINDNFGVKVPLMLALNKPYANIGLSARFYPKRKNSDAVVYAIAPTVYVGKGQDQLREYMYDTVTGEPIVTFHKVPRTQVGFILNHSLNIYVAQQVYLGLEGGIGINYYDNRTDRFNNNNNNLSFAAQFHMAVGYRF